VLTGDLVAEISKIKQETDGEIIVYVSCQLVRTLLEHTLADELRLIVLPVVLGDGERLFDRISDKVPLRFLGTRAIGNGITFLNYRACVGCISAPAGCRVPILATWTY
jgi:dihydrofolate reductase